MGLCVDLIYNIIMGLVIILSYLPYKILNDGTIGTGSTFVGDGGDQFLYLNPPNEIHVSDSVKNQK